MRSGGYSWVLIVLAVSATAAAMVMLTWAIVVVTVQEPAIEPLQERIVLEPAPRHLPSHPVVGEVVHLPEPLPLRP